MADSSPSPTPLTPAQAAQSNWVIRLFVANLALLQAQSNLLAIRNQAYLYGQPVALDPGCFSGAIGDLVNADIVANLAALDGFQADLIANGAAYPLMLAIMKIAR